jgi:hypothetical protein
MAEMKVWKISWSPKTEQEYLTHQFIVILAFKPCESVGDLGGNEPCFYLLSIPGESMRHVLFSPRHMIGWALYQGYNHQKVKISVMLVQLKCSLITESREQSNAN